MRTKLSGSRRSRKTWAPVRTCVDAWSSACQTVWWISAMSAARIAQARQKVTRGRMPWSRSESFKRRSSAPDGTADWPRTSLVCFFFVADRDRLRFNAIVSAHVSCIVGRHPKWREVILPSGFGTGRIRSILELAQPRTKRFSFSIWP